MHHLGKGLDRYIGNCDIFLLGDFNSELSESCLNDFCDICNLKNLIKDPTCYKNHGNPSCIDIFLTNRPRTFQCTTTIAIFQGISDFHKLMVTVLKTFYKNKRPKIIHYRNYENYRQQQLLQRFKKRIVESQILQMFRYQNSVTCSWKECSKKMKYIRLNNCNFMTKELRKQLWTDQN